MNYPPLLIVLAVRLVRVAIRLLPAVVHRSRNLRFGCVCRVNGRDFPVYQADRVLGAFCLLVPADKGSRITFVWHDDPSRRWTFFSSGKLHDGTKVLR